MQQVLSEEGPPSEQKFCEKRCAAYFCGCAVSDIVLLLLAIPFLIIVAPVGLVLSALAPGLAILYFAHRFYRDYVTIGQMAVCFFEIILWMIPLLLWDLIWVLGISPYMKQDGLCSVCVLAYAVQSYFFAGFCEELIKYWTINRLRDSVMTADWRSFVVYGICAGCGFACAENIMYTLSSGYGTAIVRAFSSVPFHCTTGCILGIWVAKKRHQGEVVPWYKAMFVPWILHGTYDFILMVGEGSGEDVGILGVVGIVFIIIGGLSYARYEAMKLSTRGNMDGTKSQNIHNSIVHIDEVTGEVQTKVLGNPRIAMWCQTSMCVCDLCCTLWCGCCKTNVDRLPPLTGNYANATHNRYNESSSVSAPMISPVHQAASLHDSFHSPHDLIPIFSNDPNSSHVV